MNIVTFQTLKEELPEFVEWLKALRNFETKMVIYRDSFNKGKFRIKFWTENYSYMIDIISPSTAIDGYHSYMGCIVSNRKDKHEIGKDLADGEYSENTFNSILKDIVSKEVQTIVV